MTDPAPKKGDRLTSGLLYRRVANTTAAWDPDQQLPRKGAFNPGHDYRTNQKETGISTYRADMTTVAEVREGWPASTGVVVIDIAELLRAVDALEPAKDGSKRIVIVEFDPSTRTWDGPAGHAHCWVDPVPPVIQKELVRLTTRERVVWPCGLVIPESGFEPPRPTGVS